MIKKLTVIAAMCLALALAAAACGCNANQAAKKVRQVTKKTYYDTQTESKTKVGDIDVSYKVFGRGNPLVMITGYSTTKDTWDPDFLQALA